MSNDICNMGCGNIGLFYSKQNKSWRCSKSPNSCPQKKKQIKQTLQEKYGVNNAGQLPQSIVKAKNKSPEHIKKLINHLQIMTEDPEVIEKRKKTNNRLYGGNSPTCSDDVMAIQRQTNLDRYGVENQFQRQHIIDLPRIQNAKFGSGKSVISQKWLDLFYIPGEWREHWFDKLRIRVDAFAPSNNTVYEFYGDYWHGNPKFYGSNEFNQRAHKTFGELYSNTMIKESFIIDAGFKLITIWESEFKDVMKNAE